jgi:hypothetical protein
MSEEIQKRFKVEHFSTLLGWSHLYVWTTDGEKALRQAKAILGESVGEDWRVSEEP